MESQPSGRPWFRLASTARMEQQQQPQPAQPPRVPPIRQASVALGRPPLLPTPDNPPPQIEPTKTQPPPATTAEITMPPQPPPASLTLPPLLNVQPSPPASPPPTVAPQPNPPVQPQVSRAQELQQAAQATNGSNKSSVDVPPPVVFSSPSPATPTPRPIVTTMVPTPESPKVIKTSLPAPLQSPRNGRPTVSPRPTPEPEPKTPPVATLTKSNHFHDNSVKNGIKFNSNGQGVMHNNSESKLIMPQAEEQNLYPSYNTKEEKHQATPNGKDSNAKASTIKEDEKDMRMITLAGENVGATMDLGSSFQLHDHKYRLQHQENYSGKKDNKATGKIADAARYSKSMFSLTNSNVQCVNNSILYNASSVHRSPGVYITFNRLRQPKSTNSTV